MYESTVHAKNVRVRKIGIVNLGQIDMKLEGATSALDSEFVEDVLDLPDCVIDAKQIINDEDFKDTGPGVFTDPFTYLSEAQIKSTPQCNAADMRAYAAFFGGSMRPRCTDNVW